MTKRSGRPENPSQRGVNSKSTCRSAGRLAVNCCNCSMQSTSRRGQTTARPLCMSASALNPRRKIGPEIRVGRRPVLQREGDAAGQPERSRQDLERTVRLALPFALNRCRDSRHVGRVVLHSRHKLHRGHDRRRQQRKSENVTANPAIRMAAIRPATTSGDDISTTGSSPIAGVFHNDRSVRLAGRGDDDRQQQRQPEDQHRHPALRFTGKYHIPPGSSGRMHPPQKYKKRQCRIGQRGAQICHRRHQAGRHAARRAPLSHPLERREILPHQPDEMRRDQHRPDQSRRQGAMERK